MAKCKHGTDHDGWNECSQCWEEIKNPKPKKQPSVRKQKRFEQYDQLYTALCRIETAKKSAHVKKQAEEIREALDGLFRSEFPQGVCE